MAPSLALLEIAVAKARADFDTKADALLAAFRHGNLARIGNAAHDADMAAMRLSQRVGDVFAAATELDAKAWDAEHQRQSLAHQVEGLAIEVAHGLDMTRAGGRPISIHPRSQINLGER